MLEVHVEQIHKTYARLVKWCKSNPHAMLMLCVNERHWKNGVGAFRDTYPCYSDNEKVKEYYRSLKELVNPKGLHVHITKEISIISYEDQFKAIKFGKDFLEELGIPIKDFTPGWFSFNLDTIRICKELGLRLHLDSRTPKNKNMQKHRFTVKNPGDIQTIKVEEVLHDYELIGVF